MKTTDLIFHKNQETHEHLDGKRYSVDALIDRISRKPRAVKELCLRNWTLGRTLRESGDTEYVLRNAQQIAHRYLPPNLTDKPHFPVLVCKRRGNPIIVDGVHRIVRTLGSEQPSYPCIYVSYRELKKCRV